VQYKLTLLLALLGFAIAGCTSAIYEQGAGAGASAVSHYTAWRISGDLTDLPKAIDNNVATAAHSGNPYVNAAFTIDLGKTCLFNMVAVDQGQDEWGYPHRMAVYTSMDGRNFTFLYACPGSRRVTVMSWARPVLARYVRLQAVTGGDRPWSVAEVYIQ
jgi:hypothetical protein